MTCTANRRQQLLDLCERFISPVPEWLTQGILGIFAVETNRRWIRVEGQDRCWIDAARIIYIEEVIDKKPPGWRDGMAACLHLDNGSPHCTYVFITAETWPAMKQALELEARAT